jgi:Tol biopolymer transport system component
MLTDDPSDTAPVFTGDGANVVFVRSVGGVSTLHVVERRGGAPRKLVAGSQPATAPRGDGIAFVADAGVTGARQILLTDVKGATPRPVPGLTAAAWQRPRFSPDGTRLVAIRGYQELVEAPLDGKDPPVVRWTTTTESLLAADWAPDGDGFVASLGDYRGDLWIADGLFR